MRNNSKKKDFGSICTSCGACCRMVGNLLPNLKKEEFPYGVKEDGMTCEKYDEETRQCTVYNNRPRVCNVDKRFRDAGYNKKMTRKQYYKMQATACVGLQNQLGDIPKELLVNLKKLN